MPRGQPAAEEQRDVLGEPNAEAMLQIRANVISGGWDERLKEMRQFRRTDARTDWAWVPQAMRIESEPSDATAA